MITLTTSSGYLQVYHRRMPTPDARFERELEIFRSETEQATHFYFALLAIHDVARHDKMVHALLNRTALFWNTCAEASAMPCRQAQNLAYMILAKAARPR
jgi:hypothetical protein